MSRLHKVEGIYGPEYDPITKEVLFTVNDIIECFSGRNEYADWIIKGVKVAIKNHDEVLFRSEDIAEMFSGVYNRNYWIQGSFTILELKNQNKDE